jgi:PHP family Zn ribbon phosphoesterase
VAPAIGAAFTTLADLFQWDRQTQIYDTALENLEVADAQSPLASMNDIEYQAALNAFSEGTLTVMRDETTQWGQLIRTPESLQKYIDAAVRRQNLPGAGEQTGGG